LAKDRLLHPRLAYDTTRKRLHLILCPWNEFSSIYDVMYYMRSDDHGRTWSKTDGSPIELPLRPWPVEHGGGGNESETISVRGQPAGGESNTLVHSVGVDELGQLHLLYSFCRPYFIAVGPSLGDPVEPRMRMKHVLLASDRWISHELAPSFAVDIAGGSMMIKSPTELHAVVTYKAKEADWLDLGYISSKDGGQRWGPIRAVTGDAAQRQAHYVAPDLAASGNDFRYVCASLSTKLHSRYYHGQLGKELRKS
jgi:hypothetical protein